MIVVSLDRRSLHFAVGKTFGSRAMGAGPFLLSFAAYPGRPRVGLEPLFILFLVIITAVLFGVIIVVGPVRTAARSRRPKLSRRLVAHVFLSFSFFFLFFFLCVCVCVCGGFLVFVFCVCWLRVCVRASQ